MHNEVPQAQTPPLTSTPQDPPPLGHPVAGHPRPMLPGTNRLAVIALIGSIVGFVGIGSLLGLILGFVALREIKQQPQKGRELAIIAMVIGGITAVIGAALLPSIVADEVRDQKAGATTVVSDELDKGDCILAVDESVSVSHLPVVPCTKPHAAEVFHVFALPDGDYPGQEAVEQEAEKQCNAAFGPYLTEKTKDLSIGFLYPGRGDWFRTRDVTCIAVGPDGTSTTSLAG